MRAIAVPSAPAPLPAAAGERRDLRGAAIPGGEGHERLVVARGPRSGVTMAVAIHSTLLGPALGGMRLWRYDDERDAIADVLRLARAMTYKAAAAGLELGGGKGVVCAPAGAAGAGREREAILLDFGDLVESLDGSYITAEDVGIGAEDMVVVATRTAHVTGLPVERGGSGDPSPVTAAGVQAAIRGACRHAFGTRDLAGLRIAVVGLGHVGERLARGLAAAGAELLVSDIVAERRSLARELGARWLEPEEAVTAPCDVLAPCAIGGVISAANVAKLRCRVVCGAANNQLADEALAVELAARGILFAPDFIVNAGGLINVYRELRGYSAERALELALGIEDTVSRIVASAERRGTTPLAAARELAEERLAAAAA